MTKRLLLALSLGLIFCFSLPCSASDISVKIDKSGLSIRLPISFNLLSASRWNSQLEEKATGCRLKIKRTKTRKSLEALLIIHERIYYGKNLLSEKSKGKIRRQLPGAVAGEYQRRNESGKIRLLLKREGDEVLNLSLICSKEYGRKWNFLLGLMKSLELTEPKTQKFLP